MKKIKNLPPENPSCPDSEIMAAFLAGTLSGDTRNQILSHIRHCNECYQLTVDCIKSARETPDELAESEAAYTRSESPTSSTKRKLPAFMNRFGRLQSAALISPIAALFLFIVLQNGTPDWETDEVLKSLAADKDLAIISQALETEESSQVTLGFNRSISDQSLAFRAGTLLSRIEISYLAEDPSKQEILKTRLTSLLNLSDSTRKQTESGQQLSKKQIAEVERQFLASPDDFYFKLGIFVESAKAYSSAGKSDLFDKAYLKSLTKDPRFDDLPLGVTRRLKEIARLLDNKSVAKNNEILYKLLQEIQRILS